MMDMQAFLSARRRGDALHAIKSEIVQEKANALGRAGNYEEAMEDLSARISEALS